MTILIVEDEKPAAEKLQKALLKTSQPLEVSGVVTSIKEAVHWLQDNTPQLIFMDIELTDGCSFRIFEEVPVSCPVIFTTAFDEYWQEAFEHNSIDYLLKPVKEEKLEAALKKYHRLKEHFAGNFRQLQQWQQGSPGGYKKRFLVKRGTDYVSIKTEDIAYFYAAHKLVCLVDQKGQKFILDQSLADLEKLVDPGTFFRVNRRFLVQETSIERIRSYPKSKLQLELLPAVQEDVIISQENVAAFKEWMDR